MKTKSPATRLKDLFAPNSKVPPVVVLTSPDGIRRRRAVQFISDALRDKGLSFQKLTISESSRDLIKPFLQELQAPSLFESARVGLIRNIEKAKAADIEPLTKLLHHVPTGVTLIIVGESLPNSQNFKKAVSADHIEFDALKGAELRRWTEREFTLQGIQTPSDELVEYLVTVAEENPDRISSAIEKYSLYLDGASPSRETLQELFPAQIHANDFDLAESILTSPRAKTELLLHHLIQQGSSPFMLMGLLGKTWASLLGICSLNERGLSGNEIRAQLGVSPWLFNKYLPLSKKLTAEQAGNAIPTLAESDYRLKDRSLGPAVVMSSLAQRLHASKKL